jgi:hypothetical protein
MEYKDLTDEEYDFTKAAADHKTPAQIIDELVQERVVAATV